VLPFVTSNMRELTGAQRVYVVLMNEVGHVHFHLLPRFEDDRSGDATALLGLSAKPDGVPTGLELARQIRDEWTRRGRV
jgi:diadenosine tetraphosphate (Ap4A) HIT family hydrolase